MPVLSISVCLGIQAGVYPLHTHTPHVPHLLLSQDSLHRIWFCVFRVSVVRDTFPPLLHLFPFLLECCFPPRLCRESAGLSDFSVVVVSTTAVRGVQGAAGELCPSGGCSLADRETMEETGGGRGVQRSQRPRQAPPSPREPRLASQPRLLLQEVSSLLKMPR